MRSHFNIEGICLNADEVAKGVSFFDSEGRKVKPSENDKYYAFVNELMSNFRVNFETAKEVTEEYFDRNRK